MSHPSSNHPGRSRERKRGTRRWKHDPDARAANLRESLAPQANGIAPELQKQLIVELLEATLARGEENRQRTST
jgi:hypothetical protein